MSHFTHLLSGHDTIECAYYLMRNGDCSLDFERLAVEKEELRLSKSRKPKAIQLGCEEFLLAGHGTQSGYPFLIENDAFSIQFGELNKPNFFVTYRSIALWHASAVGVHERFIRWAESVGMHPYRQESLSRVDFTFDYQIHEIDFDETNFVSQAVKDVQHRKHGKVQTFRFGTEGIVLRVYNKTDEIDESSAKTWFYEIWGVDKDVWRIEWQVRKAFLRFHNIRTFSDLAKSQGNVVRMLVEQHTTLRTKNSDSNRSRWPLHPLWQDLSTLVSQLEGMDEVRELDMDAQLDERLMRIAISMYGYMKRVAAISSLQSNVQALSLQDASGRLNRILDQIHDPLTWQTDVERRMTEMRLGEW